MDPLTHPLSPCHTSTYHHHHCQWEGYHHHEEEEEDQGITGTYSEEDGPLLLFLSKNQPGSSHSHPQSHFPLFILNQGEEEMTLPTNLVTANTPPPHDDHDDDGLIHSSSRNN